MSQFGSGIQRISARPLKIVVDSHGETWFCDAEVDGSKELSAQGCSPSSSNPHTD